MQDSNIREQLRENSIIDNAIKLGMLYTIINMLFFIIGVLLTRIYSMNFVWNICFAMPLFGLYIADIVLICISSLRCIEDVDAQKNTNRKKAKILFSSTIVLFSSIFIFFMYILMTIIIY